MRSSPQAPTITSGPTPAGSPIVTARSGFLVAAKKRQGRGVQRHREVGYAGKFYQSRLDSQRARGQTPTSSDPNLAHTRLGVADSASGGRGIRVFAGRRLCSTAPARNANAHAVALSHRPDVRRWSVVLVESVVVTYFIGTSRWCKEVVETYRLDPAAVQDEQPAETPHISLGLGRHVGGGRHHRPGRCLGPRHRTEYQGVGRLAFRRCGWRDLC